MKTVLITLICVTPWLSYAISPDRAEGVSFPGILENEPRVPGYVDANGKQGFFTFYGKDMPEKVEYAATTRIEEGNFKDNKKVGEWIVYHTDGLTPKLIGNYSEGRPNGAYSKFNDKGGITEKGSFNNGKQLGTFVTYHDNGVPKCEKTFNAEGKEDGQTTFYYDSGQPQFVVNKVNGVSVGEAIRYWEDGSIKEIITYGSDGKVVSTKVVNAEPPTVAVTESGAGGPNGSNGVIKDGKKFEDYGYNKVYNKADELWMDGDFKGGKLWNGKLYKYDSDGILLKIEIWKNGAYHSDGQL